MLTKAEKQNFIKDGFLVKHIPLDRQRKSDAIDLTWNNIKAPFDRNDPSTWKGDIEDCCRVASIAKRRGRVKLREAVRDTPWLVEMVFGDPDVLQVVNDLLGPNGVPRKTIRGLYPVFPSPTSSNKLDGGMDAHPFQLCCITYLADVGPNSGGFTVWPGSHHVMKHAFDGLTSPKLNARRAELEAKANQTFTPFEITGPAGTRIFWHYRLLHTAGTNRSQNVRHALIGDFILADWESRVSVPNDQDFWQGWAIQPEDQATKITL